MTVDDEGMLWVALGLAGAVHRYRPDGTLDGVVEVPTSNPTSVAFGGADGGDLYITTSWVDCEQPRRPAAGRRDLPLPPRRDRAGPRRGTRTPRSSRPVAHPSTTPEKGRHP